MPVYPGALHWRFVTNARRAIPIFSLGLKGLLANRDQKQGLNEPYTIAHGEILG